MKNIEIITYDIPRLVKVRKFDVNVDKLKDVLINHKNRVKMSNRIIAEYLDLPITKVEHWFRSDNSFSIPGPEYWLRLKELLSITTNEFDLSILTFEERLGIYDKTNRVYGINGLSPTITSTGADIRILVNEVSDE